MQSAAGGTQSNGRTWQEAAAPDPDPARPACSCRSGPRHHALSSSYLGAPPSPERQLCQTADQMGCNCCRMIKSYIYDPSVTVDVPGQKRDASTNSLYQCKPVEADGSHKARGCQNFGYSSKSSEGSKRGAGKLEIDNNEINRLHQKQGGDDPLSSGGWSPYIIEPENSSESCTVPKYSHPGNSPLLALRDSSPGSQPTWPEDTRHPSGDTPERGELWEGLPGDGDVPGGTFGYAALKEAGYASTTSLSTTDTRVSHLEAEDDITTTVLGPEARSSEEVEVEVEEGGDDGGSVTDSDVAEALAALEAATAGEDYE
ncbi:hypothetical protein GN956_G16062 [Arapaima gigas]